MTAPATLLLAQTASARQLAGRLGDASLTAVSDPYEAILAMGRQSWSGIVLSAPQPDFEGLCRAARRLARGARLVALCPPHAEPNMLPLSGELIDDYLVDPPTAGEWRAALTPTAPATPAAFQPPQPQDPPQPEPSQQPDLAPPDPAAALTCDDFVLLAGATANAAALEAAAAELVQRRLGLAAAWRDADAPTPPPESVLLTLGGDRPRVLAADDAAAPPPHAAALLDALRRCLPALAASARRNQALHRLAVTDELTGAYNRRYFIHLTNQILARAAESDHRVTLLLYDIDDFKQYNDRYGHAAGDEILRETAELIKQTVRSQDIVARIGGDEFAVLFWDAQPPRSPDSQPPESAYVLAERFRLAVASHQFPSLGPDAIGVLGISGGLAQFARDGRTTDQLLAKADEALIAVKRSGKNAIRLIG